MALIYDRPQMGIDPMTVSALIGLGGQILGGAMQPGADPNAAILRHLAERERARATLTYVLVGVGGLAAIAAFIAFRRD